MTEIRRVLDDDILDETLKSNYGKYLDYLEEGQEARNNRREIYAKNYNEYSNKDLTFGERLENFSTELAEKVSNFFNPPENITDIYHTNTDRYRGMGPVNEKVAVDAAQIACTDMFDVKNQFLAGADEPELTQAVDLKYLQNN